MCFAPQRHALFRHLNLQKWSEREVLLAFSLANVLRATTACTALFPHLNFQKWSGDRQFLTRLTSKCASRHNGVHFFVVSTSKSAPKLRCFDVFCAFWLRNVLRAACNFSSLIWPNVAASAALASEPTFRPSGAKNHWKNTVNRDFCTFSPTCIFFPLTLSLLWSSLFFSPLLWLFPPLLFHVHIVGSLTSKLPSISRMSHKWSSFRRSTTRIWCRSAYTSYVASNQSGGSTCRSARMISKPIASTK